MLQNRNCRRAFPNNCLLERTSCPFLVLRVSLRCLIYKVHTAIAAGALYYHSHHSLVNTFFKFLRKSFDRSSCDNALSLEALTLAAAAATDLFGPLVEALAYINTHIPLCQHLFSTFFKFFQKSFSVHVRRTNDHRNTGCALGETMLIYI